MSIKLFVEGGGDGKFLHGVCRQGFAEFLKNAGLSGKMPRIFACGSRNNAYRDFCIALANGEKAMLLVDSEATVDRKYQEAGNFKPWEYLRECEADQWDIPEKSTDTDCHLMVQCMENWFLADREALQKFYGQGFKKTALPSAGNSLESIAKQQVFSALEKASKDCKTKGPYSKGAHSFKLLALIDPAKVSAASPWAKRFLETLQTHKP